MNRNSIFILIGLISISLFSFGQNPDYSVFQVTNSKTRKWFAYKNNNQILYKTITEEAFKLLDERGDKISKLKRKSDWENYQKNLYSKFFASLNKFEKTPLNTKVTGTIKKDNYKVEKILFESHPGFYVTGCLFIPKKRENPAPVVIYVSGHSAEAFRSPGYQGVILNLVEKGFIVFAYDPIGQGERLQYVNTKTNLSKIGGPTTEHSYAGVQTLLTGTSLSDYFIWDGVRAIDFLTTRKEVDINRIGLTGRSGGGTQTAQIAAYDKRIFAAAPECYITSFKRLLQSIGPQDAEQNPYNAIKLGFDHPDYLHLRAPKPALIITTTRDFFSQQGARETYTEAKKSYAAFGKSENIRKIEDFGMHESTKANREAMYAFFQKYLNLPGDSTDHEMTTFAPEELWVTKTGQLGTSLKSKTVFDLNQEYFKKIEVPQNILKETIRELSGVKFDKTLTVSVINGKITGDGFEIEKYFLENNKDNFALPAWVVKTAGTKTGKIMVWFNPKGKEKILESKMFLRFLKSGYTIISADLPGTGELFDINFTGDGFVQKVPFNYTFGANLSGHSIPGIQADAIDMLMQFVEKKNKDNNRIYAFIEKEMNSPFLHFTTFKNPFSKVVFLNPLVSNESLIHEKFYDPQLAFYVVPGSVPFYDFNDLISFLPKNSFKIINPVNALDETKFSKTDETEVLTFFENMPNKKK